MAISYRKIRAIWFDPPGTERTYAGSNIFVPKINQLSEQNGLAFFSRLYFLHTVCKMD